MAIGVYSTKEEETLEQAVVKLLKKYDLTMTTAEFHRRTGWQAVPSMYPGLPRFIMRALSRIPTKQSVNTWMSARVSLKQIRRSQ